MNSLFNVETSVSIHATPAQVWKALTTPDLIKKYLMGADVSTDWKEGSTITYTGSYEGRVYHDKGVIKRIEPEKVLQSTYLSSMSEKEDQPENYKLVTYSLIPQGQVTILTLTQNNNATEAEKNHAADNWRKVLQRLKEVVESETRTAT